MREATKQAHSGHSQSHSGHKTRGYPSLFTCFSSLRNPPAPIVCATPAAAAVARCRFSLSAIRGPLPATGHRLHYNTPVIALAKTAMSIATWLFFIGFVGSLIVVVISFIEDLSQLGGKD